MRVLVTGMTTIHVGAPRSDSPLVSMVVRGLRDLGLEVENRPVTPDEILTGAPRYARIIVFLAPAVDLHVKYVLGALGMIGARSDAVLAIDDWQVARIPSAARTAARYGDLYLFDSVIARNRSDAARMTERHKVVIRRGAAELASDRWARKLLLPAFPWGDPTAIPSMPVVDEVIGYDPTAYLPPIPFTPVRQRRRAWVLAALGNRDAWLKKQPFTWPVERVGYPEKRVDEAVVLATYAATRGVLAPRYRHPLSGWWRPRYAYAAQARSIVYVSPDEAIARAFPNAYGAVSARLNEIELAPNRVLDRLADDQRRAFESASWSADRYLIEIGRAVLDRRVKRRRAA